MSYIVSAGFAVVGARHLPRSTNDLDYFTLTPADCGEELERRYRDVPNVPGAVVSISIEISFAREKLKCEVASVLFHFFAVLRPAAQSILIRLLRDLVVDPDFHIAICIAAILFLDK